MAAPEEPSPALANPAEKLGPEEVAASQRFGLWAAASSLLAAVDHAPGTQLSESRGVSLAQHDPTASTLFRQRLVEVDEI